MSTNYFEDDEDDEIKPVDRLVIRPAPLNAPELPAAKRVHDPAPRPRPQPLDVAPATEWIPGQKNQKNDKKAPNGENAQHLLSAFSISMKALSVLIILGVLAGIGYFVYWIISQYGL